MKLYYTPLSHNCRRVVATVHHINAKVELKPVDPLKGEHKSADFLRVNPNGMLPALEDGSLRLWESNAIMQYVAEKSGDTTLFPKDPQARADVTRWQFWSAAHWNNAAEGIVFENVFKGMMGQGGPSAELLKDYEAKFNRFAAVLNGHLESNQFIVGKGWTLADFSIASALTYKDPAKIPVASYKHVLAWYDRVSNLEAWRKSAPPSK